MIALITAAARWAEGGFKPTSPAMSRKSQPVFRCPHCLSIRAEQKDLGGTCPSCFEKLAADLQPAYWLTDPHPFQRSQGMGVPLKLLAGLVVGLCVLPAVVPGQMPAPAESQEAMSWLSQRS